MSVKSQLRNAVDAIENAQRSLKRTDDNVYQDDDVRRAMRDMESALAYIQQALIDIRKGR